MFGVESNPDQKGDFANFGVVIPFAIGMDVKVQRFFSQI